MRNLVVLFIHFIATLARLLGPGGLAFNKQTAGADCSMERLCPIYSMAPVVAIVWMVAGVVLKRRIARPRWRD